MQDTACQPSNLGLVNCQLLLSHNVLHLRRPRPPICTEAEVLCTMTVATTFSLNWVKLKNVLDLRATLAARLLQ